MKETKRALRRHHRQRMIARALKSWNIVGRPEEERLQRALRRYDNMQWCSCYMCGQRRKWYGLTVQERRQLCAVKYFLEMEMRSMKQSNWEATEE